MLSEYFDRFPHAQVCVEVTANLNFDTLRRTIAYGGHTAYLAYEPTRSGGEVELPIVYFEEVAGFEQFKLAFEDLIIAMDFRTDRVEHKHVKMLEAYRASFGEVEA